MRTPTLALALAVAVAVALPSVAATHPQPAGVCTTDLIESVSACVDQDCATIFLGPSATPVCWDGFVQDPYVCTTDLVSAVSVCETSYGCYGVYAPGEIARVCPKLIGHTLP